ncbi:MAG: PEP-CTERM sorting domain-containing protein [Moorea sp. SIO2B7]|nr:PEP-CTERM sorting domain-containing protein [Moorena sp. SIO2B7]
MGSLDATEMIAGVVPPVTTPTSQYGNIFWLTGTYQHRSFIEQRGGHFVSVSVPEPSSTLSLMTVGAIGMSMGWYGKRRRSNS